MTAPGHRSLRALCALAGCTALLTLAHRHLSREDLSEPDGAEERRRCAKLDADRALAVAHLRTREAICQALADGHLPLLQAAARLRASRLATPRFHWDVFRQRYPANSDAERFCREAIDTAVGLLDAQPGQARAVRQRLEAELSQVLRRGCLRLPLPAGSEGQEYSP